MKRQWSAEEKTKLRRLLSEGCSIRGLIKEFTTSAPALRKVFKDEGIDPKQKGETPPPVALSTVLNSISESTIDDDRAKVRDRIRDEEHKAAKRKYLEVLREQELDDKVVDIFNQSIHEAYLSDKLLFEFRPFEKVLKSTSVAEEAVLVISDTHVGKIVEQSETNGFGNYNPFRYLMKLQHLERTVSGIIQEKNECVIGNPIKALHIILLGDLVDGMLNHAEEIPGHTYISQQVHLAAISLFQSIVRLSMIVDDLYVYGVGGNHARWPNQKRPPTVGRFSNLDTIVMEWIQSLVEVLPLKNIHMKLERSLHQLIDIQGTRICASHGDQLKGGDKAMGIPIHAIAREIHSMTQRLVARNEKVPRYYIVADKHKKIELPTARGAFMVNGAFPGTDGYSISGGFSETMPEQIFFGLHPRFGRTWSYNLNIGDDMLPPMTLDSLDFKLPTSIKQDLTRFI